jgi:hypothetical protein
MMILFKLDLTIVASLTENFENFSLKETSIRIFFLKKKDHNFSFKKVIRHPAPRNDETKLAKRVE